MEMFIYWGIGRCLMELDEDMWRNLIMFSFKVLIICKYSAFVVVFKEWGRIKGCFCLC